MSIRVKLALMFLVIALIPALFVSALTFTHYKNSLEANRLSQLQYLAIFKADEIEAYLAGLKSDMETVQGFYNIKKNLPVLSRLSSRPSDPRFLAAKKMLDGQLRRTQDVLELSDIMLLNPDGRVVYASNPERLSKDFLKLLPDPYQKAFAEGKNGIYFSDVFFNKAQDNKAEMLVSAAAFNPDGVFIGIIAFEADMARLYSIIQDVTGLGDTGEILVGKKTGNEAVYLNPLRHDPQAALKRRVRLGQEEGYPIQEAVQGRTGAGRSVDYRGREVIAAWRYLPSLEWGVVAKIDSREAFADVAKSRNLVMIILAVVFILSSAVAFSMARSISEPIKRLSSGAEIIGSGNLDYSVATDLKDEIGQLSRSFDRMTRDLKKITASRDELNREIAERKQAEEALIRSKQEWERTFDSVPDLIAIIDNRHRILRINKAMAQRLGIEAEQCVGLPCYEYVHGLSGPPAFCPHSHTMKDCKQHMEEILEPRLGGHFLVSTTPLFDEQGRLVSSVHVARDITEIKQAEEERERLLEDLKRSNKELEQFAYIASHDLQEPLRMVSSYVQLISQRYKDRLDRDADEFIDYAVNGTAYMQTLLNDLLTYSRAGTTSEPFALTDLNSVLGRAIVNLKNLIDDSHAEIKHEGLPAVYAHKVQMVQVFQNLIGNAIKFHGSELPRVHISAQQENNEWIIRISDNGIGIDPKYFNRIFHIFKRLHSREKYDGTGIGLAICKKIVEKHGGRIWVESEPGKGSTFCFTIPATSHKI
jgi:PAS domain S-box-containing protein